MIPQEIVAKLRTAGLTDGEALVYLALTQLGQTTSGAIVEQAGISSSKIYDILDRLEKKGLVMHVVKNNRKVFSSLDPSNLESFLDARDQELHDAMVGLRGLLPVLTGIRASAGPPQEVLVGEGAQAMKVSIMSGLQEMNRGETYYIMGVPRESMELLPFFQEWHKRRVKKGIYCKMLFNQAARVLGEMRKKMPLTEVRYLPEGTVTPALIDVIPSQDMLSIALFGDRPFYLAVHNRKLAQSFLAYFNLLWKAAKP